MIRSFSALLSDSHQEPESDLLSDEEESLIGHGDHPLLIYTARETITRQYDPVILSNKAPRCYQLVFFYWLRQVELLVNIPLLIHNVESDFNILGQTEVSLCHKFLSGEDQIEKTFEVTRCPVFFRDLPVPAPYCCPVVCECITSDQSPDPGVTGDCLEDKSICQSTSPHDIRLQLPGPLLCWKLNELLSTSQLSRQGDLASLSDLFFLLCGVETRPGGVLVMGLASVDSSFHQTWPM